MIVVCGATGTVGRELVNELARRQAKVRALSRDPSRTACPPGVEAVAADPASPQTLGPALAGAERVFILATGPARLAHETNLVAAAGRAGAGRLVKLSALTVEDDTGDDLITGWHRAAEHAVTASGMPWTILRPGAFMSNTLAWAPMIQRQGRVVAPYAQVRTAAIDPADIAAAAAAVLLEDGHDGRAYPLTGPEPVSAADQARILGAALGRQIGVTEIPAQAARDQMIKAGTPAQIADAVLTTLARAGTGPGARVLPTVAELTGRPARPFGDWARRHIDAFRQGAHRE
jgi:(4-alkanoyl-5-oxo-2,5-dihydrofuran-3-yl)methyl phosphate reductase